MAKVNYLSIAQAEKDPSPHLWVVNISSMSIAETFADVLFRVPIEGSPGESAPVCVAMTWLPQDLNEQVPKHQILRSVEFRQAVSKNVVAIVDDQYAHTVMGTDGARTERRRMDDLKRSISRAANPVRTLVDSGTEVYNTAELDRGRHGKNVVDGREVLASRNQHETFGVSESFFDFAGRLPGMSDGQAMNELRARPTLKRSEMRCVMAHLGQDHSEARDYMTGRLARLDAKKKAKAAAGR